MAERGNSGPENQDALEIFEFRSSTSDGASWAGGWFAYGGNGSDQSASIYFAMPPGKRLGRHTDTVEETQFILSGSGELLLETGTKPVRAGDLAVLPEGTVHDLRNTGSEDLRVIAFFSAPQVEQHWNEDVWQPGNLTVTGSPNR